MDYLRIENLKMKYQHDYILENFSLEVHQGELLVLLGESGCGKSSLLKIIAGLIKPESGKIILNNVDITDISPSQRRIGYVPQAQILFPHLTIRQNIAFGLNARHFPKQKIIDRVMEVAQLTQITSLLERLPSEISGGQKQRVALARAMAIRPHLLLLDEPLSSIDTSGREQLALIIRGIQQATRTTVIYVTHNQEEARLIADRIAIIYSQKIQQIGTIKEIEKYPNSYQIAKVIGKTNLWPVFIPIHPVYSEEINIDTPFGNFPTEIFQKKAEKERKKKKLRNEMLNGPNLKLTDVLGENLHGLHIPPSKIILKDDLEGTNKSSIKNKEKGWELSGTIYSLEYFGEEGYEFSRIIVHLDDRYFPIPTSKHHQKLDFSGVSRYIKINSSSSKKNNGFSLGIAIKIFIPFDCVVFF
ncbi:MAG: ABC transporter ATP-binding protein [Promethearchaeota archaeon]